MDQKVTRNMRSASPVAASDDMVFVDTYASLPQHWTSGLARG